MREFNESGDYKVKNIDRPKEVVETIHGLFRIVENQITSNSTPPLCYGCYYKTRKVTGAPCVHGKWCGHLNQILKPIRLFDNKEIQSSMIDTK